VLAEFPDPLSSQKHASTKRSLPRLTDFQERTHPISTKVPTRFQVFSTSGVSKILTGTRSNYHADLRAKHVQVDRESGSVLGYLDWGVAEDEYLPYLDLVHLVVHERKQMDGLGAGKAWRIVCDREDLRRHEREALERYRKSVEIDDETARALEAIYPVLVAAMAERSWEYSRPRWLHRQFGI
jgi:hypothetical protein